MARWAWLLFRILAGGLGVLVAAGVALWVLLPEEYVVRGPMLTQLLGRSISAPEPGVVERRLEAPEGYKVTIWAKDLSGVRTLRFSPDGSLLASQPRQGQIMHLLGDRDRDGVSDGQQVLISKLDLPNGIDFHENWLYIAESGAITRVPYVESGRDAIAIDGDPVRIVKDVPKGGNHWRRLLRFGPDGGLYLTVGSSCNVCEEEDPRRAAILRYEPDGSGEVIYASGLRNSAGFDWQPNTNVLFATDNGRDLLGDDYPSCELNRIEQGGFYGWPFANANQKGGTDPDPDFGKGHEADISKTIAPVYPFAAHNAPLGIHFVRHPEADPTYRGAALVALHGSWNRSELDGYEVVSLHWDSEGRVSERPFLTGFELEGDVIGRPVDVAEGPDGAFFVSDDYAGVIYKVDKEERSVGQGAGLDRRGVEVNRPGVSPLAQLDSSLREALKARGATLFAENNCGSCHVAALAAPGVAVKKLENLSSRYTLQSIEDYFLAPQSPMPIFELTDIDRRALGVYIFSEYEGY